MSKRKFKIIFYSNINRTINIKYLGYIILNNNDSWIYNFNGFYSKVRAWVKPDPDGVSLRSSACKES